MARIVFTPMSAEAWALNSKAKTINGTVTIATIAGVTAFTAGGNLDIGAYDFRAATLTADGLTSGRVPFAGAAGLLVDDADMTFAVDTLTVTKIVGGTSISTDSIIEKTAAAGVTIDGVTLKDGGGAFTDLITIADTGNALSLQRATDTATHILFDDGGTHHWRVGWGTAANSDRFYIYDAHASAAENVLQIQSNGSDIDIVNRNLDLNTNNINGVGTLSCTPDAITATAAGVAASVATGITEITTDGGAALDSVTLANGTVDGQIKHFVVVAVGNAGDSVDITPATMTGGTQITFEANPLGLGCTMIYNVTGTSWTVVANNGGAIA